MSSLASMRSKFESEKKDKDKEKEKDKDKDKKEKKDKESKGDKSGGAASPTSKDDDDPLVREALANGTWKKNVDDKGRTYFYNPKTKTSTWDLGKELRKGQPAAAAPKPAEVPGPSSPAVAAPPPPQPDFSSPAAGPPPPPPNSASSTAGGSAAALALGPAFSGPPLGTGVTSPVDARPPPMAAAAGSGDSGGYTDPMKKLLSDNDQLRALLVSGSKGQLALDFQAKYDAAIRTNAALTVQAERLEYEHGAMARALTEANKKIHELQMQLVGAPGRGGTGVGERTRDEELQMTMAHLREQNRVLVTQIAELTTLLARGLNEQAFKAAEGRRPPPAMGDDGGTTGGAALITRFLDSGARHILCPNCVVNVSRYRDRLLQPTETNVGRMPGADARGGQPGVSVPLYAPIPDMTSPPATYYYSASAPSVAPVGQPGAQQPQPQQGAATMGQMGGGGFGGGFGTPLYLGVPPTASVAHNTAPGGLQHESPSVMYGGFYVKSARVPT